MWEVMACYNSRLQGARCVLRRAGVHASGTSEPNHISIAALTKARKSICFLLYVKCKLFSVIISLRFEPKRRKAILHAPALCGS